MNLPDLPVREVLVSLLYQLQQNKNMVLVAPPGAGKTTVIPLALLDTNWSRGSKIIVLEPRRLAARAAAHRMAKLLGERVGETVGYRVRMDSRISANTRIEVITDGVFTRMIQDDPELSDTCAILFDEFHERSLDNDLGLALAIDVKNALRNDLRILVMSATLNGAAVANLIDAEVIESLGRTFPVTISYHERPVETRLEPFVAKEIHRALAQQRGDILVFLPGQREIEQVAELLATGVENNVVVAKLYGAMDMSDQDRAIRPAIDGQRKVVLATSIAETSLTIDGVNIVIDSGLARLPRYDPANGLTRLETVRAAKSSIDQRAGRAGRTAPGIAIRLWREQQTASLPVQSPPEILAADLSHLVLDLAAWGTDDPTQLCWLDEPPVPALLEAKKLLRKLNALDDAGGLTDHGKMLRTLSIPPRIAHMVLGAAQRGELERAALLSVVSSERGLGGNDIDLETRCEKAAKDRSTRAKAARELARKLSRKVRALTESKTDLEPAGLSIGAILSLAWPERIARRSGQSQSGAIRYRLANGSGAEISADHQLAKCPWLVIADIAGKAGAARILSAASVSQKEIEQIHDFSIEERDRVDFNPETSQVKATRVRVLGSLKLSESVILRPDASLVEQAILDFVRQGGISRLRWHEAKNSLRRRLMFLHVQDPEAWPDVGDTALVDRLDEWFSPIIIGKSGLNQITVNQLDAGLRTLIPWDKHARVDQLAPTNIMLNDGSKFKLRYENDDVILSARAQKLFGIKVHPTIMDGRFDVLVELLSPAGRPIQMTRDLAGFWQGSWADVRSEMRSRYPKHYWPESPIEHPYREKDRS